MSRVQQTGGDGCASFTCVVSGTSLQKQNGPFSATPTSGAAPLAVQFLYKNSAIGEMDVDFGDGSSKQMSGYSTCATCGPLYGTSHTYTSSGTFHVTATAQGQVIGVATISVGSQLSGAGASCGGNAYNPPQCAAGLHCVLGSIPDQGGTCAADVSGSSCTTPWGDVIVQSGGSEPVVQYFSNGPQVEGPAGLGSYRCELGLWTFVPYVRPPYACTVPLSGTNVPDGTILATVPNFTNGNTSTSQEAYGSSERCDNGNWTFIPKTATGTTATSSAQ